MKVGILTFHKSTNYGSVLQTLATQKLLQKNGYEAEVIDYEPESFKAKYDIYVKGKGIKPLLKNMLRFPLAKYRRMQMDNFAAFRDKNLVLSKQKYGYNDDFTSIANQYDCVLCGSDQIWNVRAGDCDDVYFLPDVNVKKIAFSVSVNNTDYTEERCNEDMKKWILDYDLITCREKSGADKISKFINGEKEVLNFLDPTLMHEKDVYYPVCSDRIIEKDYVFLYKVWGGDESYKLGATLAKRLGMPVYTLLMTRKITSLCKIEMSGVRVIKDFTGPGDYLSLIRNANYVVTDSFHGTAFSLIFEKKFICVKEKYPDGREKNDERIVNILATLGLSERYVALDEISDFPVDKAIDYSEVTKKRLQIAQENTSVLFKAIEG